MVIACLAGYIVHFVGLGGMNGSVSMAHRASVLLICSLRGWCRIQRLQWDGNEVEHVRQDIVVRELDWLALQLLKDEMEEKAGGRTSPNREASCGARFVVVSDESTILYDREADGHHPVCGDPIKHLLTIRTRLGVFAWSSTRVRHAHTYTWTLGRC